MENYSNSQKISSIYQFTFSSLKTLIDSGINVGMVQIGNETNGSMCGMGGLYDGVWNLTSGVGDGLKSGCNAVNDINKYYGYSDSKRYFVYYISQIQQQLLNGMQSRLEM